MMKGCDIFAPPVEVPITAKLPLFTPFEESYRKKKKIATHTVEDAKCGVAHLRPDCAVHY